MWFLFVIVAACMSPSYFHFLWSYLYVCIQRITHITQMNVNDTKKAACQKVYFGQSLLLRLHYHNNACCSE